jgi:hypothetical protein
MASSNFWVPLLSEWTNIIDVHVFTMFYNQPMLWSLAQMQRSVILFTYVMVMSCTTTKNTHVHRIMQRAVIFSKCFISFCYLVCCLIPIQIWCSAWERAWDFLKVWQRSHHNVWCTSFQEPSIESHQSHHIAISGVWSMFVLATGHAMTEEL